VIEIPTLAVLVAAITAAAAPPTPTPVPTGTATPAPASAAPATSAPTIVESPASGVSPAATASLAPAPTATPSPTSPATASPYAYRFVPRQPAHPEPGAPQIFAVYLNGKTLRSRGPILIKVETDLGTVKVTSRSNGREGIVPRIAPGDFEAASTLPKIPFIASGITTYLDFIATSASGLKTTVRVPIALQ
jgi:hypothetical protein